MPPDWGLANKNHSGVKGREAWPMPSLQMWMDLKNFHPSSLEKQISLRHFKKRLVHSSDFTIITMPKLGWHWPFTRNGFWTWIRNYRHKTAISFFCKTTSQNIHIVPDGLQNIHVENFEPNLTAHVQPMNQGSLSCKIYQTCCQPLWHRCYSLQDLQHQSTPSDATHQCCLVRGGYGDHLTLLEQSCHSACYGTSHPPQAHNSNLIAPKLQLQSDW